MDDFIGLLFNIFGIKMAVSQSDPEQQYEG
jgi:hypothetical protein